MQAPVAFRELPMTTPLARPPVAYAPGSPRRKLLVLALISGAMLFLCHFPVAWGWLGWVALVPLLPLVRAEVGGRWRYFCAWVAGSVYFWPAISWMTVADTRMVACWALLSFYCSLYFPLAIALVRRLERGTGWPLVLTFPAVWTALECWRAWFGTGFSWYLLGYTQHDALPVIQIADLGGVFAVSFLVAAVNCVIFEGLTRIASARRPFALRSGLSRWTRPREDAIQSEATAAKPKVDLETKFTPLLGSSGRCFQAFGVQLGIVAALLAATLGYGAWRLAEADFEAGPRIALIQGNVDQ